MTNAPEQSDAHERRTLLFGMGYGLALVPALAPFVGIVAALSAPLGAVVALANFWLLARSVKALLQTQALGAWSVAMIFKLLIVVAILFGLMNSAWVSFLPFVLGLGAVPIAITLAQLFQSGAGSSRAAH